MKKSFKKFLLVSVMALSLCGGVYVAYATTCDLVCPNCAGKNINHFHPNEGVPCWAYCRDCEYEWFEENPEQESTKKGVDESSN